MHGETCSYITDRLLENLDRFCVSLAPDPQVNVITHEYIGMDSTSIGVSTFQNDSSYNIVVYLWVRTDPLFFPVG